MDPCGSDYCLSCAFCTLLYRSEESLVRLAGQFHMSTISEILRHHYCSWKNTCTRALRRGVLCSTWSQRFSTEAKLQTIWIDVSLTHMLKSGYALHLCQKALTLIQHVPSNRSLIHSCMMSRCSRNIGLQQICIKLPEIDSPEVSGLHQTISHSVLRRLLVCLTRS